jgi:L-ascorbate metabolism protein UlaG (beta-lactamase superfamily)
MDIVYLGHSCFRIKSKEAVILTDPFNDNLGIKMPKVSPDIVCCSHQHDDHCGFSRVTGEPFIITEPGEYEIKGVSIIGLPVWHDDQKGKERGSNTVYLIEVDGFRICHLGDLGHILSNSQRDEINGVDVLMIPVGGVYTIDPKRAVEVIAQIEPKIVLPMHFKTEGLNTAFKDLATLDDFLKEAGVDQVVKEEKLKLNSLDFSEELKIIVLKRKS